MKAAERLVVERADGVVCLTEGVREALASFFQLTAPTLILPSGTDPPPAVLPDDTMRDMDVFYAGKLSTRKGIDDLIRALRFLPGVRCWIAGGSDDEVETLRAQAEDEGVADRVTLLGFVAPGEVRRLYARARVGVCPLPRGVSRTSERYTSPMKILNMMALGTPVVATDLPSVREMLDHGRTALLAPPSNPRAFATAIRKLLDDRVLASKLARAAREEVETYTWGERARRLHDFLGSIP
jgi:glycosyltransferase involved in cell wall biosynthesis